MSDDEKSEQESEKQEIEEDEKSPKKPKKSDEAEGPSVNEDDDDMDLSISEPSLEPSFSPTQPSPAQLNGKFPPQYYVVDPPFSISVENFLIFDDATTQQCNNQPCWNSSTVNYYNYPEIDFVHDTSEDEDSAWYEICMDITQISPEQPWTGGYLEQYFPR